MKKQPITQSQILTDRLVNLQNFFQEQTGAMSLTIYRKQARDKSTITELELITAGLLDQFIQEHSN